MADDHTKLPWEVTPRKLREGKPNCAIVSPGGDAELGNWFVANTFWTEDAAYIVKACNAYPELIATLEHVQACTDHPWDTFRDLTHPDSMRKGLHEYVTTALAKAKVA